MDDTPAPESRDPHEEWLNAARGGSPEALGRLLELCRAYLLQVANAELDRGLQAKAGASDLVQETFVEAQRIFDRFQGPPDELRVWLRAILLNKLATFTRHYRDTARRRVGQEVPMDGSTPGPEPAATAASPSSLVSRGEQVVALTAALSVLPEDYRQVIIWRQMEDLSFDEIATRLGRTPEAVRKLWWRAIQQLQREMAPPERMKDGG